MCGKQHRLNRSAVPGVQEVSIGHALIADALELGYAQTVREYQRAIRTAYAAAAPEAARRQT